METLLKVRKPEITEELLETNIGFKFLFSQEDVAGSAILRMQWCIAPEILKHIHQYGTKEVFVFLDVRNHENKSVYRMIMPFTAPQAIIEFNGAGEHKICGALIRNEDNQFAKFFCEYPDWWFEVDDEKGLFLPSLYGVAEMTVTVQDKYFTPELSKFEDWYLNLVLPRKPLSSCEINKRRWFAYPIQTFLIVPLAIPISVFRLLLAILTFLVMKNVPWKIVVNPFAMKVSELFRLGSLRFSSAYPGKTWEHLIAGLIVVFLAVVAWKLLRTVWLFIQGVSDLSVRSDHYPSFVIGLTVVASAVVLTMGYLWNKGSESDFMQEVRRKRYETARKRRKERKQRELEALCDQFSCTTAPPDLSLRKKKGVIPTLTLTYQELKVKWCKPARQY